MARIAAPKTTDDTFAVAAEVGRAVEEDGLLSLFALCRDADLRPLADLARRVSPECFEGRDQYVLLKNHPARWPNLLAEGLDFVAKRATEGWIRSGGSWQDGVALLASRLRLKVNDVDSGAATEDAIAHVLLKHGTAIESALSDERLRGLEPLTEAILRVALLRRALRSRVGLPPLAQDAAVASPSAPPGFILRLIERLAAGANVWDEVMASVPGADFARLPRCNIAIAGCSGAGKSTLLNAVFGRDLAATGVGRPVTQCATWYEEPGFAVRLLDTRGLERGAFSESIAQLEEKISGARAEARPEGQLHLVWLCIDGSGGRIEESDRRIVEMASRLKVPVIVVLTKAWFDSELKAIVRSELLDPPVGAVVRVVAASRTFSNGESIGPRGLESLVEESLRLLPEARRAAMAAVQRVLLAPKIEAARHAIDSAGRAASAVAATPIPLADAVLLVPIQVVMIVAVTRRMGVVLRDEGWKALAAASAGPILTTFAGRFAATALGNALKSIPPAGFVIGSSLNSAIAMALTRGLGEGYLAWLTGRLELGRTPTVDEIRSFLSGNWFTKS
jgi:uncharacterized protein (DUF697 family)/GTP-binding protein EngB required for normal cell division